MVSCGFADLFDADYLSWIVSSADGLL